MSEAERILLHAVKTQKISSRNAEKVFKYVQSLVQLANEQPLKLINGEDLVERA